MRTAAKVGLCAGLAAAMLLAGGIGPLRTPGDDPVRAPAGSSVLLAADLAGGSLDAQIDALQDRLRAVPDDWRGYASLGLAYVSQARVTGDPTLYPKAERALARSLRINGTDNVDGLLGLGALALARHGFSVALGYGRRAARLDPYDADAYGVIGDALLELGRYDRAFDAFQTMVDTRPGLPAYARASYARELLGDVAGARRAMELAFDAAGTPGDRAWAAHQLGELAFGSGEVASAARWYRRGLDLEPSYVPNLAGLAKVAWARGDVDLAIERYRQVVARYPSPEHVVALVDLYRITGRDDLAAAQEAVVRALQDLAVGSGVNVDLELALFDADHGDPAGALEAARSEWARRHSIHVADALSWALYANGRLEAAAAFSGRALALGTPNALFLFHAGMIRLGLGDDRGARRYLLAALEVNPNFSILYAPEAQRALARLEGGR
jgi:tetratricopeptide (TPR) repeat protein